MYVVLKSVFFLLEHLDANANQIKVVVNFINAFTEATASNNQFRVQQLQQSYSLSYRKSLLASIPTDLLSLRKKLQAKVEELQEKTV